MEVKARAPVANMLDVLDDDCLRLVLLATRRYPHDCWPPWFPFVATCRAVRKVQVEFGQRLESRTSLEDCASSLSLLRWAIDAGCPYPLSQSSDLLCLFAAKHGCLEVLQYARTLGCPWQELDRTGLDEPRGTCAEAARAGHIGILKYCRLQGCPWGHGVMASAARMGHMDVLNWLREAGCPSSPDVACAAAEDGKLDVLRWLHEQGADMSTACEGAMSAAGALAVLKMAHNELGAPLRDTVVQAAAEAEEWECFKWLLEEGCKFELAGHNLHALWSSVIYATEDWDLVSLMHERGVPWHKIVMPLVISMFEDPLPKVKWLREHDCPLHPRAFFAAVENWDFDVIQYLHTAGVQWHEYELEGHSHNKSIQEEYLVEDHDRYWTYTAIGDLAVASGSVPNLEWLLERAPHCVIRGRALSDAARLGHFDMVAFLRLKKHFAWQEVGEEVDPLENSGHRSTIEHILHEHACDDSTLPDLIQMLRFVVDLGCPLRSSAYAVAAQLSDAAKSIHLMQWLRQAGCPLDARVGVQLVKAGIGKIFSRQQALNLGYHPSDIDYHGGSELNPTKVRLLWLKDQGCEWDQEMLIAAAGTGDTSVVEWLLSKGVSWGNGRAVMTAAAKGGHLKTVQWLRCQGCQWGAEVTIQAAAHGHETLLRWALRHGCRFDRRACFKAIQKRLKSSDVAGRDRRLARIMWWGEQRGFWVRKSGKLHKLLGFTSINENGHELVKDA